MTEAEHQQLTTYAALALHDDGADITAAAISKMIEAAGASVPAYYPMLWARMLNAKGCGNLLASGGGGGGGAAAAGGDAGGAAPEAKKEEVKEEEEEEDMEEPAENMVDAESDLNGEEANAN